MAPLSGFYAIIVDCWGVHNSIGWLIVEPWLKLPHLFQSPRLFHIFDDMGSKQVHTEVPVDGQTFSKYSLVRRTVDSDASHDSSAYH